MVEKAVMFMKKPFKKGSEDKPVYEADRYIDLGSLSFDEDMAAGAANMYVRVAEIHRYEDLATLTNIVYNGNMLILDFNPIANDRLTLKRVTNELKSVVADTNGDLAGISKNFLVVTPGGVKIDRAKIKAHI